MRDGWYIENTVQKTQRMRNDSGLPKGMQAVLKERGIDCCGLRGRCVKADHHTVLVEGRCCMTKLLGIQPDFLEQKPLLQEIVEERGHLAVFLPKVHCELNMIEYFWGASKRHTRENCDYTFDGLRGMIPEALGHVSLKTIRRWEQRMWRCIDCYAEGKGAEEADSIVKKYTSHRRAKEADCV